MGEYQVVFRATVLYEGEAGSPATQQQAHSTLHGTILHQHHASASAGQNKSSAPRPPAVSWQRSAQERGQTQLQMGALPAEVVAMQGQEPLRRLQAIANLYVVSAEQCPGLVQVRKSGKQREQNARWWSRVDVCCQVVCQGECLGSW